MYSALKPILFSLEPERVHDLVMKGLALTAQHKPLLEIVQRYCAIPDSRLEVTAFGLRFPNPVGLAAGMDKNAVALPIWAALGFGFAEIGSVTAHAQPGNPQPRMFRLPEDEAIINRMGFNNHGSSLVAQTLGRWQRTHGQPRVPLGINLGKSKITSLEDAPGDYLLSLARLWEYGDYFVVNVSSPNTPGLRELQDKDRLEELLSAVMGFVKLQAQPKPLLLKIAPDLTESQLLEILELTDTRRRGDHCDEYDGLEGRLENQDRASGRVERQAVENALARGAAVLKSQLEPADCRGRWDFHGRRRARASRAGRGAGAGLHRLRV